MEISENSFVEWTEKVESISRVNNPLGIWSHLNIQVDYLPGITSITDRVRYYTLLAWCYQHLREDRVITEKGFERLFILTCLSHHNGDYRHPSLKHVFNIQRFKDDWANIKKFELNFPINGFARTYYNRQLDILRCCWTDYLNNIHKSSINEQLASCLPEIDIEFFKKNKYTRQDILDNLSEFCICQRNVEEIDLMSKLLFGFITHKEEHWVIDEETFQEFITKGIINFNFQGTEFDSEQATNVPQYIELSQRRKNSLFMFLKIIYETEPMASDFYKAIYNALFFRQNTYTKEEIDFGNLSKVMDYWELLQLNVYYVYAIEKILDVIQRIVRNENGILRQEIFSAISKKELFNEIGKILEAKLSEEITLADIGELITRKVSKKSSLEDTINESILFDSLSTSTVDEHLLSNVLIMLFLLNKRFASIAKEIKQSARLQRHIDIQDRLFITQLFEYIIQHTECSLSHFLRDLFEWVVQRNLYESAMRFKHGTKNWLFTDEDSRLFFSRRDLIDIKSRDNRWDTVLNLLRDLEMIEGDKQYKLSEKGKLWLKQAGLI